MALTHVLTRAPSGVPQAPTPAAPAVGESPSPSAGAALDGGSAGDKSPRPPEASPSSLPTPRPGDVIRYRTRGMPDGAPDRTQTVKSTTPSGNYVLDDDEYLFRETLTALQITSRRLIAADTDGHELAEGEDPNLPAGRAPAGVFRRTRRNTPPPPEVVAARKALLDRYAEMRARGKSYPACVSVLDTEANRAACGVRSLSKYMLHYLLKQYPDAAKAVRGIRGRMPRPAAAAKGKRRSHSAPANGESGGGQSPRRDPGQSPAPSVPPEDLRALAGSIRQRSADLTALLVGRSQRAAERLQTLVGAIADAAEAIAAAEISP